MKRNSVDVPFQETLEQVRKLVKRALLKAIRKEKTVKFNVFLEGNFINIGNEQTTGAFKTKNTPITTKR